MKKLLLGLLVGGLLIPSFVLIPLSSVNAGFFDWISWSKVGSFFTRIFNQKQPQAQENLTGSLSDLENKPLLPETSQKLPEKIEETVKETPIEKVITKEIIKEVPVEKIVYKDNPNLQQSLNSCLDKNSGWQAFYDKGIKECNDSHYAEFETLVKGTIIPKEEELTDLTLKYLDVIKADQIYINSLENSLSSCNSGSSGIYAPRQSIFNSSNIDSQMNRLNSNLEEIKRALQWNNKGF